MPARLQAQDSIQTGDQPKTTAKLSWDLLPASQVTESRIVQIIELADRIPNKSELDYQIIITANTGFFAALGLTGISGSPAKINGLAPGTQVVSITKEGYKPLELRLKIRSGVHYQIQIELAPETGVLTVSADQDIQVLEIDGSTVLAGLPDRLQAGMHRVLARRFGQQDYDQSVLVRENMATRLDISFAPAAFAIHSPQSSRVRFRPGNPGSSGTSTLSFQASTSGNGQITVMDKTGSVVRTKLLDPFSSWTQSFIWDGRDENGENLPDGDYQWKVQAKSDDSPDSPSLELTGSVAIDSSSFIKFRDTGAGPAGLPLVSDSYTLPQGAFQTAARFDYLPAGMANGGRDAVQVALGIRFGIIKGLEFAVAGLGQLSLGQDNQASSLIGASLSWAFLPLPDLRAGVAPVPADLGLALNLAGAVPLTAGTIYPYQAWSTGLVSGGRLGLAAHLRIGLLSLLIEPVVYLSPWKPTIANPPNARSATDLPTPSPTFFASANAGVYVDADWLLVGISASLRTAATFMPELPIPVSIHIQFMPLDGLNITLAAEMPLGSALPVMPKFSVGIGLVN